MTVVEPYKQPERPLSMISTLPTAESSLTSHDIPNFSLKDPFNLNISLATVLSGNFSISFPSGRRSVSESALHQLAQNSPLARPTLASGFVMTPHEESQSQFQPPRPPSPAPTEIEDPEPEAILEHLNRLGIKVHDYAFAQTSPASFDVLDPRPSQLHASTSTSTTIALSASARSLSPSPTVCTSASAPEIFDQYKGIAEFEYRVRQIPRTYPIQGKTLRRLLDLKWVTLEEARSRLDKVDWDELERHDARGSTYPWRPCRWTTVPNTAEREDLLLTRGGYFISVDRMRWQMEVLEEREAHERALAEKAQERLRVFEEQRAALGLPMSIALQPLSEDDEALFLRTAFESPSPAHCSKKRALEHSVSTPEYPITTVNAGTAGPSKRARLNRHSALGHVHHSFALSPPPSKPYPVPPAPPKQYPAPLSSYDPALYPEAAGIIEAEARPASQRQDTPPLDDGDSDRGSPPPPAGSGHPLRRRRKLRRSLSRTQTFTQL